MNEKGRREKERRKEGRKVGIKELSKPSDEISIFAHMTNKISVKAILYRTPKNIG